VHLGIGIVLLVETVLALSRISLCIFGRACRAMAIVLKNQRIQKSGVEFIENLADAVNGRED
jgi:hypothetical protein